MKTQLIQLEPHDDLTSIRDKMDWSKTPRILLVWPIRERVSLRPLDLKLLQRHAQALGAQMGLVTTEGEIKAAARELDIPTFKTSSQARKTPWQAQSRAGVTRRLSRESVWRRRALARPADPLAPRQPAVRLGYFSLGVLAALVMALVFVPTAQIELVPIVTTQTITLPVSAAPDIDTVYLSGNLPLRTLTVQVEAVAERPTTDWILVPDQPASGEVEFSKLVFGELVIPAGTVVRTADAAALRYATLEPLRLLEGEGQKGRVAVRAMFPGSAGNLAPGEIIAVEGGLGLSVSVINLTPTAGGNDRQRPAPAPADLAALREDLLLQLREEASAKIARQLLQGDQLISESLGLIQVLEEEFTPAVGMPGSRLTLRLRAEFQSAYAAAADLEFLSQSALDAALPPGYVPVPGTLSLSAQTPPIFSPGGVARWQMRATRNMRTRIDPPAVMAMVRGIERQAAIDRLSAVLNLAQPAQITIWPDWWQTMPFIPFRITVK